jgi:UDP-glucose:(heptosyl)LPS alpha-1,3-glucosyltransferase
MRIAVVIESFNPAAGGNERSTQQILEELTLRGHEVTLVTGCCDEENQPPGVTTRAMSRSKSSSVFRLAEFAIWARRRLAEEEFDTSLSVTMAVPARVLQPRGGTVRETLDRNVAMRGGGWASRKKAVEIKLDPKQQLLLQLEKRTLADPRVHRVVALSRYVVRQLETHYDFPAERTVVIPNAAVMPKVTPEESERWRTQVRGRFGIADTTPLFLFAAQNPKLKGYPTLVRAVDQLLADGKSVAVLLAGGFDPDQPAPLDAADLDSIDRLRAALHVVGPTREMPPLYAAADATVLPSWYDPSSKVVLESVMMATPAISTIYNGASDHLAPESGPLRGWVVQDPGDDVELVRAMTRLTDPAFRSACAAACAGLADQLSMTRHVDALEQVLTEAAGQAPNPDPQNPQPNT